VKDFEHQVAYEGCSLNERAALVSRHIIDVNEPDPAVVSRGLELLWAHPDLELSHFLGQVDPWSPEKVLAHKESRLKRRYGNAFESLTRLPLQPKDNRVAMFVKFEKWPLNKIGEKAPRAIQFRNPRYTASIASFLMPVEKCVFRLIQEPIFAKGLNTFERGERLGRMDRWVDTVWLNIDHSKFDAHMTTPWLRAEHAVYNALCRDPDLARLLRVQLSNRCRSKYGTVYTCEGRKMSGEYNTSLGDSLVNFMILHAFLDGIDAEVLLDGDDSVVALSGKDMGKLDFRFFERAGMDTKVEVVNDITEVRFCQCGVVKVAGRYRAVRDPIRVLSRGVYSVRRYSGRGWLKYLTAWGEAELAVFGGIPVLQEYALYLRRHGRGEKPAKLSDWSLDRRKLEPFARHPRAFPITEETRASFYSTFGMSITEQVELEEYFRCADHSAHVDRLMLG
jgi:hypothetical protein